jgi:hypothetical protein
MIDKFLASFTSDLARPSKFNVLIKLPSKVAGAISTETLAMRCEMSNMPGRTIETADLRIYGPSEKFPHRTSYDDITMTFIVSDSMKEKKAFDNWLELINPSETWNMEYKKNYVSDITISQYDVANEVSYAVKLIDAFPLLVNQLDLDWSNETVYHKLSVVFTYRYWQSIEIITPDQQAVASTPTVGGPAGNPSGSSSVQDTINDQAASYTNQFIGGMNLMSQPSPLVDQATTYTNQFIGGMNL